MHKVDSRLMVGVWKHTVVPGTVTYLDLLSEFWELYAFTELKQ